MMRLTKNFWLHEFECPCGCKTDGVPMDVGFMMKLQKVREIYDKTMIVSRGGGYRCPAYNSSLKNASPRSMHMKGLAADVGVHTAEDRYHLVNAALAIGMTGIGIYSSFVHLDYRKGSVSMWWGAY